ncbi:SMI1/KNR4 family protein [Archangium lipolyticum]|uniref:SMI1/KNR4 family protein n=1 Tax=Archangium lipolyticum TaxID=2970465 RepID=UPI00214A2E50|nr:SMI1/KNR4 family protein [Archangium lipolyticum]
MDEFIARASQWDPGFPARIRGATAQEIQALARLTGLPLPGVYEAFLARMGHGDGDLDVGMDGTTDISAMIDYYRDSLSEDEGFPPHCIVIGTGSISSDICLEIVPTGEPRVVFTEGNKVYGLYAESLMGLLFRNAFLGFRLYTRPSYAFYASSYAALGLMNRVDEARRVILELGFEEEWFSDSICVCAERGDTAIGITQFEKQGMGVSIGSRDASELARIGEVLKKKLGLSLQKPR